MRSAASSPTNVPGRGGAVSSALAAPRRRRALVGEGRRRGAGRLQPAPRLRPLRPLAVLQRRSAPTATSTPMCASGSTRRAGAARCWRAGSLRAPRRPAPPARQHLLRRRHALADGAGDGGGADRARGRALRASPRTSRSRSRPTRPRSRPARFAGFAAAGVNRLSLGVQALDDAASRFLGRQHSAAEALAAVALARARLRRASPST